MTPLPSMVEPEVIGASTDHDRLDGWKEIAAHIGRGVRTAQRWEREQRLPIHRLERKTGEVVYAFRSEIDAWWRTQGHGVWASSAVNGSTVPPEAGTRPTLTARLRNAFALTRRLGRPAVMWFGPASLAGLLIMWPARSSDPAASPRTAIVARSTVSAPASFSVDGALLRVRDGAGRDLWSHSFPHPVDDPLTDDGGTHPTRGVIADLDQSGPTLLFIGPDTSSRARRLYRFGVDGQIVFVAKPPEGAWVGGSRIAGDYAADRVIATADGPGSGSIWVAYRQKRHSPAVVHKLDAAGRVRAEYWTTGPISLLQDAFVAGRHVLMVGASDRERSTASLAVLDYDNPSGSAPSDTPNAGCTSCPPGQPLAVLRFPSLDVARALTWRPRVDAVEVASDGKLTVSVLQADNVLAGAGAATHGTVLYMLTPDFRPMGLEFSEAYRALHSQLRLIGELDHRFGPADLQDALTLLTWQDQQFRPFTVPSTESR